VSRSLPITLNPGERLLTQERPGGAVTSTVLYAGVHFAAAREAARRMLTDELAGRTSSAGDALAAIMCAVAAAEAFVTEQAVVARACAEAAAAANRQLPNLSLLAQILLEEDVTSKASITSRYACAKLILTGSTYAKGQAPFQDFAFLVTIRNSVAHLKPSEVQDVERHRTLFAGLVTRKLCAPPYSSLLGHLMTTKMARFACSAASDIILDLGHSLDHNEHGVAVLTVIQETPAPGTHCPLDTLFATV